MGLKPAPPRAGVKIAERAIGAAFALSIDHSRLPGLAFGKGASRCLERGTGQRCLSACRHRTDTQQASMGLFADVESVTMAMSHMPHHNGLGGPALRYEFVDHVMVIRDLMGPSVFPNHCLRQRSRTRAGGKSSTRRDQARRPIRRGLFCDFLKSQVLLS